MQEHQKPLGVKSLKELEDLLGKELVQKERLELARTFKFLAQENNPHVKFKVSIGNVKFRNFYEKHKAAIDKLHFLTRKYYIDPRDFIEYSQKITKFYTPELIITPDVFKEYAVNLYTNKQYETIYRAYSKTVENISRTCVDNGIRPKEFLSEEFRKNRIAYDFISGRISKYFLVTIKDFKKIYEKLDQMNKDELRIIYDATDELKVMANEALVKKTGRYPTPIRDSEEAFDKMIKESTINKNN